MSREILHSIIEDFNPDKFVRFFREKNRSFAPRKEELLQYDDENFKNGIKIGEIQFAQDEKILVCAFEAGQPLSERSGKKAQYEKGKKILRETNADAGIFIFYDRNGSFRFSLIYPEYLGSRSRQWSYFKRFTYFINPALTNKTLLQQIGEGDFSSLQKIKEAFSVEPVTRQFYGELQNWYFWAMDKIKFPDDYKYSNDPIKDKDIRNATNLIRLITRIIFIRFLTEKGLIPPELFSREKLGRIVKDFMKGKKASNFYNAILQNLFFGTLNQKMNERKFAQESGFQTNRKEYGVKNFYRYGDKFLVSKDGVLELFKDIPFLNGGLFDCLDKENGSAKVIYVDGFSRNPAKQSIIPDFLFFQQEEEKVDISNYGLGASRPVRGLIEILNSYNFTIDENTLVDQEIALDPELLGKVFENLLASYNPETATTARKATGSYYTPREIVDYMVEESLSEYLKGKLSETEEDKIRMLLSYSEEIPEFSAPERQKIISAIDDIKILDPACGSGAFPMGILHKLVYALQKLDPENKYWHELQYQKALKESGEVFKQDDKNERQERLKEINETFDEGINYPDYARKLYLIENCIYGVDIQPIAIQISKLRFFISLVLDQKVDRGKENLGIRALPNLETKFVAANTLIGLDRPEQLTFKNPDIKKKEEELKQIRHKYFEAKTRKEKLDYQKKDQQIRTEIADLLEHSGWDSSTAEKIATFDLYDQNASAEFFEPEWMFGITDGFDVVIGNPPYVGFHGIDKQFKQQLQQIYVSADGKFDLYLPFIERSYSLMSVKGFFVFICPTAFTKRDHGEQLRQFLRNNVCIKELVDFEHDQMFEGATNYTGIFSFIKDRPDNCSLIYRTGFDDSGMLIEQNKLTDASWVFSASTDSALVVKIEDDGKKLHEVAKISEGVVTGLNDLYLLNTEIITANAFELKYFVPCTRGKEIDKYYIHNSKELLFYPYRKVKNKTVPVDEQELIKRSPKYCQHLKNNIDKINSRAYFTKSKKKWYELWNQRDVANFSCEKIITPELSDRNRFALTGENVFYGDTVCGIIINDNYVYSIDYKFLLAVLNSKLIEWYYKKTTVPKAGGFFIYKVMFLKNLPIKVPSITSQQKIITLVDQILTAKKKDPKTDTSALEHQIDRMVYKLYGLTPEEIAIVEGTR